MPDVHAVVVGAGFAGLYMLHRLRGLGLSARVFEAGDGVGGTWYWNRYPGARCDVESMDYSYSFSDELQQEWSWTERYASQPEILSYLNHVADRFDLRRDIQLATRVTAATFDEAARRWTITTDRGDRVSARFCIMATGCLSTAQVPKFPGLETLRGPDVSHRPLAARGRRLHRPARGRDRHRLLGDPVDPDHRRAGRRISSSSSARRTSASRRTTRRSTRSSSARSRRNYADFRRQARESRVGFVVERSEASALEVTDEERRREYEERWRPGRPRLHRHLRDLLINADANDTAAEFCRDEDPRDRPRPRRSPSCWRRRTIRSAPSACASTPTTTRRSTATTSRWSTSARTPIEAITPDGLRTRDAEYDARQHRVRHRLRRDDRRAAERSTSAGAAGARCSEKWADGARAPTSGSRSPGFPNLFTITGPGSPSVLSNMIVSIEQHVDWIADCIDRLRAQGHEAIEATAAAQEAGSPTSTRSATPRSTRAPTPGTWAPTSRASRASSCPTSAASAPTGRSATTSPPRATRASR